MNFLRNLRAIMCVLAVTTFVQAGSDAETVTRRGEAGSSAEKPRISREIVDSHFSNFSRWLQNNNIPHSVWFCEDASLEPEEIRNFSGNLKEKRFLNVVYLAPCIVALYSEHQAVLEKILKLKKTGYTVVFALVAGVPADVQAAEIQKIGKSYNAFVYKVINGREVIADGYLGSLSRRLTLESVPQPSLESSPVPPAALYASPAAAVSSSHVVLARSGEAQGNSASSKDKETEIVGDPSKRRRLSSDVAPAEREHIKPVIIEDDDSDAESAESKKRSRGVFEKTSAGGVRTGPALSVVGDIDASGNYKALVQGHFDNLKKYLMEQSIGFVANIFSETPIVALQHAPLDKKSLRILYMSFEELCDGKMPKHLKISASDASSWHTIIFFWDEKIASKSVKERYDMRTVLEQLESNYKISTKYLESAEVTKAQKRSIQRHCVSHKLHAFAPSFTSDLSAGRDAVGLPSNPFVVAPAAACSGVLEEASAVSLTSLGKKPRRKVVDPLTSLSEFLHEDFKGGVAAVRFREKRSTCVSRGVLTVVLVSLKELFSADGCDLLSLDEIKTKFSETQDWLIGQSRPIFIVVNDLKMDLTPFQDRLNKLCSDVQKEVLAYVYPEKIDNALFDKVRKTIQTILEEDFKIDEECDEA